MYSSNQKKIKKDVLIELSGSRYYKVNPDKSMLFKTRLVSKKGVYSFKKDSPEANLRLLEIAGLVVHENCYPYLATSQASYTHKANAELRKVESIEIRVRSGETRKMVDYSSNSLLLEEAAHLPRSDSKTFASGAT